MRSTVPARLSIVGGVVCLFPVSADVPLANHTPLSTDQRVLHLQGSVWYIMRDLHSPREHTESKEEVPDTLKGSRRK